MFRPPFLKKIFIVVLLLGVIVASALTFISYKLPDVGQAPTIQIERTAKRIERGKYLALNVMACMNCHSKRDWKQYAAPIDTNHLGAGGTVFGREQGIPGSFPATNLTPLQLKNWTDGELYRAITSGVSKDGRALFPIMPYLSYGKMATEDIYSVIAYLRTLSPIESKMPAPVADFPMNFIINTIPQKVKPQTLVSPDDKLAYGGYLVLAADCRGCHTADKGKPFAGGRAFKMGKVTIYSSNITSHKTTGIGAWTETAFIARFKAYEHGAGDQPLKPGDFQTIMPWREFGKMSTSDLAAIFTYLKSVQPVKQENPRLTTN